MTKTGRGLIIILCLLTMFAEAQAGMLIKGKLSASSYENNSTPSRQANRSVLPKRGDIAVLVEGANPQHKAMAEAMIIEELASRGYRVVDEAKMKRIKMAAARAQAARYALEGNVEAILRINAHYSAAATVIARVQADSPVVNEFKLYTGTASAAFIAVTSGGKKLGGKTAQSKTVGYTPGETMQNALNAAVRDGMQQLF